MLAMFQDLEQELADLRGTSFMQPAYPLAPGKLPMDTVQPPLFDNPEKTRREPFRSWIS